MRTLVLMLLLFIVRAYGTLMFVPNEMEKAPPGGCFTSERNIGAMEKGEQRRLVGECTVADCDGGEYISFMGCGLVSITCRNGKPAKKLSGDLLLEYPRCCPELLCPEYV